MSYTTVAISKEFLSRLNELAKKEHRSQIGEIEWLIARREHELWAEQGYLVSPAPIKKEADEK